MPKLLVLLDDESAATVADAVASGARGVRFMEVDVRSLGAPIDRVRQLESAGAALQYDGVVIAAHSASSTVQSFLADIASAGDTSNTVFACAGSASSALLARCAVAGGILVAMREPAEPDAIGARAAKVVGWVRHALGHEAGHHHHH